MLAILAATVLNQPSPRLFDALQANSEALMRLTTDFRFQLPKYQIYSFYEMEPMKKCSSLVSNKKINSLISSNRLDARVAAQVTPSAWAAFVWQSQGRVGNVPRPSTRTFTIDCIKVLCSSATFLIGFYLFFFYRPLCIIIYSNYSFHSHNSTDERERLRAAIFHFASVQDIKVKP